MNRIETKWQVAIFCVIHLLILAIAFNSGLYSGMRYSSVGLFFDYSSHLFSGEIPYKDFLLEYPPVGLVFFSLPYLFASNFDTYTIAFVIQIAIFNLLGLVIISSISQHLGVALWKTLTVFTLALLAIGPIIIHSYDLIPSMLVLSALYVFCQGKRKTAWAILAVATMTKFYPVIIAPIFLLCHLYGRQYRQIGTGVVTFFITIVAIGVPFVILSPDGVCDLFGYHIQRGLQVETIYSSFLLMGHILGLESVQLDFNFGSWQVVSPQAGILAKTSVVPMFLCLTVIYWFFYRGLVKKGPSQSKLFPINPHDTWLIIHYSLLAILIVIITGKVLSPQYIIWLYPLVPLIRGRWGYGSWAIFILLGAMTYYVFPEHYLGLLELSQPVVAVLFCRNVLLMLMAALLLVKRPDR